MLRRTNARRCCGLTRARIPTTAGSPSWSGELSTESEAFRSRWDGHNVRFHDAGIKRFHHPVVGDLTLSFNQLEASGDPGLAIIAYAARPGSRDEQALKLLASWSATVDPKSSRLTPGA